MKNQNKFAPQLYIFDDAEQLAENLACNFQQQVQRSGEKFTVALSGGGTPTVFFTCLASAPFREEICWEKVHFFWGDERCVPPDHAESNYRMTRETLLDHILIPAENIHRIRGEVAAPAEAQRYAGEMGHFLEIAANGFPIFDWIILGLGTDGHTASLFPNALSLREETQFCVAAVHPQTGQQRVSLTLPVINQARRVSFLVTGSEKANLVRKIIQTEELADLPAARVKPAFGRLEWYLDEAAAPR
jgi:6-phosphogluconolactonase